VKQRCGIGNHNISCRFKHFVGRAPKAYAVHHRVALAKRLLHHKHLTVAQVAFAVGYASPNGFSTTFKRQVGVSPTAFRRILRQDL
jgi:AraC-like DNA-binding protein